MILLVVSEYYTSLICEPVLSEAEGNAALYFTAEQFLLILNQIHL
jgi:hypothetical protein